MWTSLDGQVWQGRVSKMFDATLKELSPAGSGRQAAISWRGFDLSAAGELGDGVSIGHMPAWRATCLALWSLLQVRPSRGFPSDRPGVCDWRMRGGRPACLQVLQQVRQVQWLGVLLKI